jgi:hypothetical protein
MPDRTAVDAPSLTAFLDTKGPLTSLYAVLCTAHWLTAVVGQRDVTTRELRAAYPRPALPPLPRVPAPSETLRRCARWGFVEGVTTLVGATERRAVRLTPLGRAVVEALPDLERVGALRGLGRAAPGRGRARM